MPFLLLAEAAETAARAEPEATLLGLAPEHWVYVGVTIFFLIAIFYAKAHHRLLGALDAQIAETRRSLDEAKAIRAEAEALLADAKTRHAQSAKDAAAMLEHAGGEARDLIARAEAETSEMIGRREKMAQDKIAAAERTAIDDLRARAARAATGAAGQLIAETHGAAADKTLVDRAIAALN